MTLNFATYFDSNYLSRGLVLYDSLKATGVDFNLFVLCLDERTRRFFETHADAYPEVRILGEADLEAADPQLRASKNNRSRIEYYFTISPCLPRYLLQTYALPHVCSLDADILFLASPRPLFDELQHYSVIITPHKFSPEMTGLEKFGLYNVSFQVFKNDETGRQCLDRWRQQCLDWCGDTYDAANDRFADQKYLDAWPEIYPGKVKALYDDVSGLAPWNLNHFRLAWQDDVCLSNGQPLIFYHFHHFKLFGGGWASSGLVNYHVAHQPAIDRLYLEYWNRLDDKNRQLGLEQDRSQRTDLSQKKLVKLLNEAGLYYRRSRRKLIHINTRRIPNIVRRILLKLYA